MTKIRNFDISAPINVKFGTGGPSVRSPRAFGPLPRANLVFIGATRRPCGAKNLFLDY